MFGYIRPYKPELKIREYAAYRAVYCGLCHTAGKKIGIFSRFFLNYDYVFLAMLRMVLTNREYTLEKERCFVNPFRKDDVVSENEEMVLSAAVFSVLAYHKALDNVKDEKAFAKFFARMILPMTEHMRKKAMALGFPDIDLAASDCMEMLSENEEKALPDIEKNADIFGEMLAYFLARGLGEDKKETARSIGFAVGRFIYFADAADDLAKDEKSGSYNPLLLQYGSRTEAEKAVREFAPSLLRETDECADLLGEMRPLLSPALRELCDISRNILYLGTSSVLSGILCGKKRKENEDGFLDGSDVGKTTEKAD